MTSRFSRRQALVASSGLLLPWYACAKASADPVATKKVAVVATVYRHNSHADVIATKILKGWKHDGGPGPALEVASLYVEQSGDDDMSRELSAVHGVPLVNTIRDAVTLGTKRVAVDGVISIGEHGDYPWNDKGQHLYPRRRFFEEITNAFTECGAVVPVFNDKHPGPVWDDALWMYHRAQSLKIPFMAGSSLPVTYRDPDLAFPLGRRMARALAVGYSGLDIYGFHTLDVLQTFMERRQGGERGVRAVTSRPLSELRSFLQRGLVAKTLLEPALERVGTTVEMTLQLADQEELTDGALFVIEYVDGMVVPVLMLPKGSRGISVAVQPQDGPVMATRVEERPEPRYPHFAYLVKAIERMMHTGQPAYPVERTMLATGILDRLLTSRSREGVRTLTPELQIAYEPVDYPHAPHIALNAPPSGR